MLTGSHARRRRGEQGTTSLEFAVIFPVLLLALLLVIQTALVLHARNLVTAAAQDGVLAAKVETGSAASARAAAETLLDQAGARLLTDRRVVVERDRDRARVEVRATVVGVVPGLPREVEAVAEAPLERFRSEDER